MPASLPDLGLPRDVHRAENAVAAPRYQWEVLERCAAEVIQPALLARCMVLHGLDGCTGGLELLAQLLGGRGPGVVGQGHEVLGGSGAVGAAFDEHAGGATRPVRRIVCPHEGERLRPVQVQEEAAAGRQVHVQQRIATLDPVGTRTGEGREGRMPG